jgi:phage shock protein E
MLRKFIVPFAFVLMMPGLASCASSAAGSEPTVAVSEGVILLDVRTPEEFAAGHLDGALRLDLNGGEFAAALPNLDADAEYLVYCRSGNRSGQAIALMAERGITKTTNLGSLEQAAAATGLAIVTE